jgi:hypothetical protein
MSNLKALQMTNLTDEFDGLFIAESLRATGFKNLSELMAFYKDATPEERARLDAMVEAVRFAAWSFMP